MSSDVIGIQLMQLIVSPKKETQQYLDGLVEQLEDQTTPNRQGIMELAITIMAYKFENLTREEIEAMFTVNDLKQTRLYKDVLEEGIETGIETGIKRGRAEGREEGLTEGRNRAIAESLQRERAQLIKQLTRKLGQLSSKITESLDVLTFAELDFLWDRLADIEQISDLENCLQALQEQSSKKTRTGN